jgi:hypothetical protein
MEGGATGPHARRPRGGESDGAYADASAAIKLVSPPRPRPASWISCGDGSTAVHPSDGGVPCDDVTVDEGKRPRGWGAPLSWLLPTAARHVPSLSAPPGRESAPSPTQHRAALSEPLPRSSTTAARHGGLISWASDDVAEGARPPLHGEPPSREPLALLTLRLRADGAEGEGKLDADLRACIAAVHDAWASPETRASISSVPCLPAFLQSLEARLRGARGGRAGRRRDDNPSNCYSVVSDEEEREERLYLGVSALGSEVDTTHGSQQDSVLSHTTASWLGSPAGGLSFTPGHAGARASLTAFGSPCSVSRPPLSSPGLPLASSASLASASLSSHGPRRVGNLARQASSAASYDGFEEYAAELDREATSPRRAGMQSYRSAMSGRELDSIMRVELVARPGGSPLADREGGEGEARLPPGGDVHEGAPTPVGVPKLSFMLGTHGEEYARVHTLPTSPGPGTGREGADGAFPPSRRPSPAPVRRPLSLSMSFSFQEDFVSEVTRQAKDEEVRTRRVSGMLDSSVATASVTSREEGGGDGIARDVEEAFSATLGGSAGALTSSAARAMVAELAEMPTHGRSIPKYLWARQSTVSEEESERGGRSK